MAIAADSAGGVLIDIKGAIEVRNARPVDPHAVVDRDAGEVGLVQLAVDVVQDVEGERLARFGQGVDALLVLGEHRLPDDGAEIGFGEAVENREAAQGVVLGGLRRADSR